MKTYYSREIESITKDTSGWFPVVSIAGPHHSGKTTLVKKLFPDYEYVTLADEYLQNEANEDPTGFLRNRPERLIIDEIQYGPELFPMLKMLSDERQTTGQYVIVGSHNYLMMKRVNQSLAGRVGLLTLLPCSYKELTDYKSFSVDEFMYKGLSIYDAHKDIDTYTYYENYLEEYLKRDIKELLGIRKLDTFRLFMKECAANSGGLLNNAAGAQKVGVSVKTIEQWMRILVQSYVIYMLPAHFFNAKRRVIKAPKYYFYDTGLLCYLLGIKSLKNLPFDEHYSKIFETLCISEEIKRYANRGRIHNLYHYKDDSKHEVELIKQIDFDTFQAFTIWASQTYRERFSRHLTSVGDELDIARENRFVVTRIEHSFNPPQATVLSAEDFLLGNY